MRLENMKNEFPKMPEDIRAMIEQEVKKQVMTEQKEPKQMSASSTLTYRKRKRMARKSFIAALVAAMALGTTVFAGVLYQLRSERVGKYAVETRMEGNQTAGTEAENAQKKATDTVAPAIPDVTMELGYLPEGMVEIEEGKYSFPDTMYQGGISIVFYRMDTGDDQFEILTTEVLSNEDITVGGRSASYLLLNAPLEGEIAFNQRIYVAYTDVHYVMEMYVGSDVTKEEALKVAESVALTPVENNREENIVHAWNWSDYLASLSEEEIEDAEEEFPDNTVSKDEMKHTHRIGESFAVTNILDDGTMDTAKQGGLMAKVADVQIADTISLLDLSVMEEDEKSEVLEGVDADGKLLPTTIRYMKYGDGIDTVSEVVETKEVPQKLVYVTVEYTNTTNAEMSEVLFNASLVKMTESGNQMKMYYGREPESGEDWDEAVLDGPAAHMEMYYYDVHGGERNNNYIAGIAPGETVTVHMAWFVPEEELEYLYLNLDNYSGSYEFADTALAMGYVDIRQ